MQGVYKENSGVKWIKSVLTFFSFFFFKDKGEIAKKEMEVKKEQLSVATEEAQSHGNKKTELGNIVKKKKQALKFTQVRHLICDLLREKGPTAVKHRFKTQLTAFSVQMLCNIFTSVS